MHSPRRKVFIAIPCYSGKLPYYTHSAVSICYSEAAHLGIEIAISIRALDSMITRCRNVLLAQFLASDATELLFIDADVAFGNGVFARLMSHQVDVVAGIYPARGEPEQYPVRPLEGCLMYSAEHPGLMEVEAVPAGFLRISRHAAERLVEAFSDDWYEDKTAQGLKIYNIFDFKLQGREYWSEDYLFCQRWREIGGKVWIDPDLPLSHTGEKVFSGHFGDFLRRRLAEQQGGARQDAGVSLIEAVEKMVQGA
jgi:hypothetical protein